MPANNPSPCDSPLPSSLLAALVLSLSSTGPSFAAPAQVGPATPASATAGGSPALRASAVYPPAFAQLHFTPIEKPSHAGNPRQAIKALYVNLYSAATSRRMDEMIAIADQTAINGLVIDVKDDRGNLLFPMREAGRFNPDAMKRPALSDVTPLIRRLRGRNIYLIARIVTFKDPSFAAAHASVSVLDAASGRPYESSDGLRWASPYSRKFQDYNLAVAREAAAAGFHEIQFDYVRFPDASRHRRLTYPESDGSSKSRVIQNFLLEARKQLGPLKVYVAADVFGLVCTTADDMDIGQYWEAVSNAVDYICPMMYPSHYGNGVYGLRVPDLEPYAVLHRGLQDAQRRNRNLATPAELRPWLQAFTATWLKEHRRYGVAEVRAQIKALTDRGLDSYLIWNSSNRYESAAFR